MTAEQLRNSILQQAISGRLVPQDPNDEPPQDWYIKKEKIDALNLRNDTWLSSFSKMQIYIQRITMN